MRVEQTLVVSLLMVLLLRCFGHFTGLEVSKYLPLKCQFNVIIRYLLIQVDPARKCARLARFASFSY